MVFCLCWISCVLFVVDFECLGLHVDAVEGCEFFCFRWAFDF